MENIKLYTPKNELLLDILVDDNSYRLREIMGENVLMLYFSLDKFVNIQEGAYCDFKTERYWLPESINYVKEHTEYFVYTLKLEGSIWLLRATKFKFFDYVFENGKVKPTSSFKLKFPITATPRMIADLLIANLRLKYPQYPWAVGDCIDSEPITLDYNHHSCFSILADIADKFKTEWELDKYTLHFRRVEKMKDSAIDLSYGYNNGLLGGINRLQLDNKKIINRVYVDGGDRNINRANYGNDTLLLPKNETITYEGIDYITDSSGSYLERVNPLSGEEDSLDISKFYPKRVGEVTSVDKINDEKGLYDVIDSTIPEDLDYSKCIIPDETMTLKFQTGQLAGTKEFNVEYVHKDRRFKLVPINDNGLIYPQGNIIPEVGDLYAVFNMNMPEKYITLAENEALQEVVKYLWENEQSQYSYRFQLDGNFAKRNWGEIRGFLNCGFFVKFSDPQFLPDPVDVRIVSVKELVNDDKRPEITIANNISSKTFGSTINEIPSQEQATDRKDGEVREYAKRRWKDTQELIDNIEGMTDEFKENLLSALVFEGMVFRAGAATLQYSFLDDDWDTSIEPALYFDKANKQFHCPASKIKHETLDINGEKPYWTIPEYVSDNLMELEAPYYLYLKCSKDLTLVDGRLTGEADFFLSTEKIKIEDLDGFYTLWVAFINSENEENDRSFTTMYGLAELLPGQLTVDTIRSSDGKSYINGLKNQIKIGGLDWNVTKKDSLTLLNALIQMIDSNGDKIVEINGEDGSALFSKGNIQFYPDGSAYLGGWTLKDYRLSSSKNWLDIQLELNAEAQNIQLVNNKREVLYKLGKSVSVDQDIPYLEITTRNKFSGARIHSARIRNGIFNGERVEASVHAEQFVLNPLILRGTTADTTLDPTSSLIVSVSNSRQNIYLPKDVERGTIIKFRQWWNSGCIRILPPSNGVLYDDSTPNDYIDINEGQTGEAIYVGKYDFGDNGVKDVWLIGKFGI